MNFNYFTGYMGVTTNQEFNLDNGFGLGVDWGFLYRLAANLNLGIMLENGPAAFYWDEYQKDIIPFHLRLGLAWGLDNNIKYAFDYDRNYYKGRDDLILYHTGLEKYILEEMLSLRVGMYGEEIQDIDDNSYAYGLGCKLNGLIIDLAIEKIYQAHLEERTSSVTSTISFMF